MIHWKLDALMRTRRLKGRELARRMGIGENYLSRVRHEAPDRLSLALLDAFCRELNCTIAELLEYVPEPAGAAAPARPSRKPAAPRRKAPPPAAEATPPTPAAPLTVAPALRAPAPSLPLPEEPPAPRRPISTAWPEPGQAQRSPIAVPEASESGVRTLKPKGALAGKLARLRRP